MFWKKKRKEVIYIDWGLQKPNAIKITKQDVLTRCTDFIQGKTSRKDLAKWAKDLQVKYRKHEVVYEYPELDDAIYALAFADGDIYALKKAQGKVAKNNFSTLSEAVLIMFDIGNDNLSENEMLKMIDWLENMK